MSERAGNMSHCSGEWIKVAKACREIAISFKTMQEDILGVDRILTVILTGTV